MSRSMQASIGKALTVFFAVFSLSTMAMAAKTVVDPSAYVGVWDVEAKMKVKIKLLEKVPGLPSGASESGYATDRFTIRSNGTWEDINGVDGTWTSESATIYMSYDEDSAEDFIDDFFDGYATLVYLDYFDLIGKYKMKKSEASIKGKIDARMVIEAEGYYFECSIKGKWNAVPAAFFGADAEETELGFPSSILTDSVAALLTAETIEE